MTSFEEIEVCDFGSQQRAYDAILRIRERLQERLRPDVAVCDVYAYARTQ